MSASLLTSISECAATGKIDDSDMIGSHMIRRRGTRCTKNVCGPRGVDKGTKQCSFVAIYASTPIWPSFREASKDRFKSPTYATKEASYVCQCQSLGRLPLIWASSPCSKVFLIRRVADNQEEGWGQVHLIAKQSKVSGQRPPSHLHTFPGIVLRKFLKGCHKNPFT